MAIQFTRRSLMAAGASALALGSTQASFAQGKPKMRFSCAFPETDLRAEGYKAFAAAMKDEFDLEPYWSNTLFKQGAELVALQRDNLPKRHMNRLSPGLYAENLHRFVG